MTPWWTLGGSADVRDTWPLLNDATFNPMPRPQLYKLLRHWVRDCQESRRWMAARLATCLNGHVASILRRATGRSKDSY